jgi:hypothetical protein
MWERWRDQEKILEHVLACTVVQHVWQIVFFKTVHIRQVIVRICFCVYKKMCIGQEFTVIQEVPNGILFSCELSTEITCLKPIITQLLLP